MKTEWDYTDLAVPYLKRPDYAPEVIETLLGLSDVPPSPRICDVGAGVAHLTLMLAASGAIIDAVEPNDEMRRLGSHRTADRQNVTWYEGTGEETGRETSSYDVVTFGSSFNVCDREHALAETSRILKPGAWFACMWNHRVLEDPLQARIEEIIKLKVPSYEYGSRREDQAGVIQASGLFGDVVRQEFEVVQPVQAVDMIEGWRSHATLARQAGDDFVDVIDAIQQEILDESEGVIDVPYVTRVWFARSLKTH